VRWAIFLDFNVQQSCPIAGHVEHLGRLKANSNSCRAHNMEIAPCMFLARMLPWSEPSVFQYKSLYKLASPCIVGMREASLRWALISRMWGRGASHFSSTVITNLVFESNAPHEPNLCESLLESREAVAVFSISSLREVWLRLRLSMGQPLFSETESLKRLSGLDAVLNHHTCCQAHSIWSPDCSARNYLKV